MWNRPYFQRIQWFATLLCKCCFNCCFFSQVISLYVTVVRSVQYVLQNNLVIFYLIKSLTQKPNNNAFIVDLAFTDMSEGMYLYNMLIKLICSEVIFKMRRCMWTILSYQFSCGFTNRKMIFLMSHLSVSILYSCGLDVHFRFWTPLCLRTCLKSQWICSWQV